VAVALVLLVTLPAGGSSGELSRPALAAAVPAPAVATTTEAPLPTLPATPFATSPPASAAPRPQPAPDRGADRRPAATTPAAAPDSRQRADDAPTGDRRRPSTMLLVIVSADRDRPCGDSWTADVRARAYGAEQAAIARVTASVAGGGAVALSGGDGSWSGQLAGLPTGRAVTVTVTATAADGSTVRSVSRQVEHDC
jgi:hypothetical protein